MTIKVAWRAGPSSLRRGSRVLGSSRMLLPYPCPAACEVVRGCENGVVRPELRWKSLADRRLGPRAICGFWLEPPRFHTRPCRACVLWPGCGLEGDDAEVPVSQEEAGTFLNFSEHDDPADRGPLGARCGPGASHSSPPHLPAALRLSARRQVAGCPRPRNGMRLYLFFSPDFNLTLLTGTLENSVIFLKGPRDEGYT